MSTELDRKVAERLGWTEIKKSTRQPLRQEGLTPKRYDMGPWNRSRLHRRPVPQLVPQPSTDWRATGWLIERYGVAVGPHPLREPSRFLALYPDTDKEGAGDTPQEAVCRLIANHGVPDE